MKTFTSTSIQAGDKFTGVVGTKALLFYGLFVWHRNSSNDVFASFDAKLNPETLELIKISDARYKESNFLTINDHIKDGSVKEIKELYLND